MIRPHTTSSSSSPRKKIEKYQILLEQIMKTEFRFLQTERIKNFRSAKERQNIEKQLKNKIIRNSVITSLYRRKLENPFLLFQEQEKSFHKKTEEKSFNMNNTNQSNKGYDKFYTPLGKSEKIAISVNTTGKKNIPLLAVQTEEKNKINKSLNLINDSDRTNNNFFVTMTEGEDDHQKKVFVRKTYSKNHIDEPTYYSNITQKNILKFTDNMLKCDKKLAKFFIPRLKTEKFGNNLQLNEKEINTSSMTNEEIIEIQENNKQTYELGQLKFHYFKLRIISKESPLRIVLKKMHYSQEEIISYISSKISKPNKWNCEVKHKVFNSYY